MDDNNETANADRIENLIPAELPADLQDLAAEANSLEGGPPVPGTPEAEANDLQNLAAQIEGNTELIEFGWQCIGPLLPEAYAERYGQVERAKIAAAYTKLAIKRGWDMGDLFEKWGPEIAFAAAVAGPGLPVFLAQMRERKEGGGDGRASSGAN